MGHVPRLAFVLTAWHAVALTGGAAAPGLPAPGKGKPADVFGLTRVWSMNLTISAEHWKKMEPTRGLGFGRPQAKQIDPRIAGQRIARGGFGYDFDYVQADLDIDGLCLEDVGVRFKGNSSYATTARILKRPFKIDLDRHVKGQSFSGLRKLVLNNNVMDPTAAREALGYAVYRAAGVPAPRTAYVQLSLTVPGKYDREFVGLYTLIEAVDRPFLAERFGSGKGLLLKPERVGPLEHLGDRWQPYADRYRPRTAGTEAARRRFIELTRLVQQPDEDRFHQEIGKLLDVDLFLRYVAATVLLSSMDSFIGLPHNYYLYHDPKTDRFVILPWDLDHSFGGLLMFGPAQSLMELSIRQPWLGRNRLVERLLGNAAAYKVYTGHLRRLLEAGFTALGIKKDLAAITRTVAPIKEREQQAAAKRGDNWSLWGLGLLMGRPPSPEVFAQKRIASVEEQLAGKSKGTVLTNRFGPRSPLLRPILAADKDKDGALSRQEAVAGARALFKACDKEGKGELDEKALTAALGRLLPRQGFLGPHVLPPAALARVIMEASRVREQLENVVNEERLVAALEQMFNRSDANKDGKVDEPELAEAIRLLLPPGVLARPAFNRDAQRSALEEARK